MKLLFYSVYDKNNEKYNKSICINNHYLKINSLVLICLKKYQKLIIMKFYNKYTKLNKNYLFYCIKCKKIYVKIVTQINFLKSKN